MAANAALTTKPNRLGPLEVFRRAKNIRNANPEERQSILDSAEQYEDLSIMAVIAGVVMEAILFVTPIPNKDLRGGEFVADMLVGLGIWLEFRYGQVSGAVLKTNLADAQLELARIDWRHIKRSYKRKFGRAVFPPPASVRFWFEKSDDESTSFTKEIAPFFARAGWRVGFRPCLYDPYPGRNLDGVRVPARPYEREERLAVEIRRILKEDAGIAVTSGNLPQPHIDPDRLKDDLTPPIVDIYVGLNPP